ncbi:MAG: hypothetical protein FJ189_10285, partial [Gammaproteobacteria bacterium]|nr:hypothetical protein [Gammaproteobacteria bacterium]
LCRVIHAVRYQCGRGVKIVVRETTASLRYPEELQVMRAGANAVVYRNQRLARLLGALETLRGHCFAGTIDPDLDRVMTALAPEQQHGYVPPRVFSGLVAATLAKAGEADLEHVLVRLRIRPDKAHVDALTAWQLKRANDLVTADEKDVYLFLFGCRESDVDATLHRLLSVPLATLFSEQVRWQRHEAIRSEIRSLTERAERQPFVDFSLLLPQCSPAATGYRESTRHSSKHRAMTLPTASAIPGNETSPVAATPSSTGPASPGATSERTVVPGRLGVLNRGH